MFLGPSPRLLWDSLGEEDPTWGVSRAQMTGGQGWGSCEWRKGLPGTQGHRLGLGESRKLRAGAGTGAVTSRTLVAGLSLGWGVSSRKWWPPTHSLIHESELRRGEGWVTAVEGLTRCPGFRGTCWPFEDFRSGTQPPFCKTSRSEKWLHSHRIDWLGQLASWGLAGRSAVESVACYSA